MLDELKEQARVALDGARRLAVLPAPSREERVTLYGDNGQRRARQPGTSRARPAAASGSPTTSCPSDHVALFVTTAGDRRASGSRSWKESGDYLKSHAFAALALETAEAAAEWLHRKLRADWGFPDPPEISDQDELLGALPRQALQLRLSGLPRSRRPTPPVRAAASGRHRRRAHRGRHDGSRGDRLGARLPPPRRAVLRRVEVPPRSVARLGQVGCHTWSAIRHQAEMEAPSLITKLRT